MIVKDIPTTVWYAPNTDDKPLTKEEEKYYAELQEYYKNRPAGEGRSTSIIRPWMIPVLFS